MQKDFQKSKKLDVKDEKKKYNSNKIQIVFSEEQREIIKSLKGYLGNTEAEIIRNIVLQHEIIRDKIKRKHEGYEIKKP